MGASASNIADETAKALISISNSAAQNCKVSVDQLQSARVQGGTDDNVNLDLNWAQYIVLDQSCLQQDKFQNTSNQQITQEAQQVAKAIAQQFSLSGATSSNVVKIVAEMSVAISNAFRQSCTSFEDQTQAIIIEGGVQNNINIYANWQQYNNTVQACVQKDQAVSNAQQRLQQTVSQEASATVENWLAGIIGAIAAVFAGIGIIFFAFLYFVRGGGGGGATTVQLQPGEIPPELPMI